MSLFTYTIDGCILEEGIREDFQRALEKRRRLNPLGQDVKLESDGAVIRDEDKIIAIQRLWKERVYAPPGTLFAKRGTMYLRAAADWTRLKDSARFNFNG